MEMYLKKSSMATTTAFRRLRNLLRVFTTVSLFKLVNYSVILVFSQLFVLHGVLKVSHSTAPHTLIIKRLKYGGYAAGLFVCCQNYGVSYRNRQNYFIQLNGFKYYYITLILLFNIIKSFSHSRMVPNMTM